VKLKGYPVPLAVALHAITFLTFKQLLSTPLKTSAREISPVACVSPASFVPVGKKLVLVFIFYVEIEIFHIIIVLLSFERQSTTNYYQVVLGVSNYLN
jgi:hypothetical protein